MNRATMQHTPTSLPPGNGTRSLITRALLVLALLCGSVAWAQYIPGDLGQRPAGGLKVLPEQFLRGFDPVTVYFTDDQVPAKTSADDGAKRLKIVPEWPGQYFWVDRRTLQFRPAEPWPALARFQFEASGTRKILTTMMAPPSAMSPSPGSEGLTPFRVVTLTFPQTYPASSLKKMLALEIRDLPGLGNSPARKVTSFALAPLPRATHRDPATWTLTLDEEVPEGKQLVINVSLALGTEGTTLWQGRVSTRTAFTLTEVRCGNAVFPLIGGASTPKDLALGCGNRGDMPQLAFSAPVQDLTLTALRKLVRLEPSVPDLRFQIYGTRVQLAGKFVPDTLYKMTLASAPIHDDAQRPLRELKSAEVYFHLGWKTPFLAWEQSTAIVELKGPRTLPLRGYGEPRADVRVHRIDPFHNGLWPFPGSPLVVDEQSPPPFPGEEPANAELSSAGATAEHLRLLGSPLVSRLVDLPLSDKSGTTHFGLDLKPLLDEAGSAGKPGTYLVGLRRLTGKPERAWVRVQITNLSVTSVEETGRAVLYVRALDTGEPVRGATVKLEGYCCRTSAKSNYAQVSETTDADGRVAFNPLSWNSINRVSVVSGDDVLVIDPHERLPNFANDHWSSGDSWLNWLLAASIPAAVNDVTLGFVFTERPIYQPGEAVFVKAFVRNKVRGELRVPGDMSRFGLQIVAPDGSTRPLVVKTSALGGLAGTFKESELPTGDYVVKLYDKNPESAFASRGFKVEAYRIPTFEVQLNAPLRVRNDAPFKVKAVARYYAGGNVAKQPIAWTVTQRPYDWVPKNHPGFLFSSSTQFARTTSQRPPGVSSQKGELDDNGAAEFTGNPQLDLDGSARTYRFEATVTGADEQPVTAYTEVKALPAFVLGLKIPRYLEKATELKPELIAVGVDDKPFKGQEIRVRLFRRVWHSTLRETSFATGQAKYQTDQEDVQVAEKIMTSGEAPVSHAFSIKESGVYVVELFARDKLGRVQTLSADLYVGGQTPQAWQKSRDGVFELKPDKPSYTPGDVAHLLVESPFASAKALVIIEEPSGNRYLWKEVSGSKAVIDLPVTDRFVPNLPVHVVLMRGRLGEGKADDARYKPATVASSIDLSVDATKNIVMVDVKHPEVARPGTKHDFIITLTDDQKQPVGGEVTLWLVDEAVLSLAKEGPLDPLTEMIQRNKRSVSIRDTRNLVIGRVSELEEEPGGDGADNEEESGGKRTVRKNFQTVPYYQATLTVPASGKLVVPVMLSDDLTTFKVRAVAVSGGMRFGFKQSQLRVRLPVLVQPQLPRFVRMGDKFWPGGVARLVEGAEGPGIVDIKLSGAVEGKAAAQDKVELKANKALSVLTPVTVKNVATGKDSALTVRVEVTRLSDKAGDAFEVKLPLLPDRAVEKSASFATLQPGKQTLKDLAEKPRPGTVSQTLVMTNQPGILELAAGLEYLSAYPHGCLEQRMSQVLPDLALGGLLKKLELDTRFTPQVQASTKRILDELKLYQDEQGFFSYWPGGRGDIALTAQGVEFLVAARRAGVSVDDAVLKRAMDALKRVLRTDFSGLWAEYRFDQQTAALRALGRAGDLDENYLVELFNRRKNFGPVALADLTSAMAERQSTFAANIAALKADLWDSVVFKLANGQQVFDGIRGERASWSGLYLGSSTGTTAAVWEALLRVDPSNPKHALLRDALISRASAVNGFGNTHANRRALTSLGLYFDKATFPQPKTTISIAGLGDVTLDEKKKAARQSTEQEQPLSVTIEGGPVRTRLQVKYLPLTPGDKAAAKKEGLIVSRSMTWLHSDGSPATHHDDVAGTTFKVPQGEVLEIHTQLVTDEARNHVALVVPIAAGLEPLNPSLETSSSDAKPSQSDSLNATYVQRLDHEVRYYFTELPRGTHTFHFRVRASNEGSFVHPSPWAELMYREEVRGRGAGMRVVVTGSHEQ